MAEAASLRCPPSPGSTRPADAAEFFLVAADLDGQIVNGGAEVSDFGDESGQRVGVAVTAAVVLDDCAEFGVAIEGGSARGARPSRILIEGVM